MRLLRVTADGRRGPLWMSSDVARMPFEVFARRCPVPIHGFVLDRELASEVGGCDESLRTCEDWDFWQRIARTGVAFLPVPEKLAPYRYTPGSLSSNAAAMLSDARAVIEHAFAPDPRVPKPAPLHSGGADPGMGGTREMAIGQFALYVAATEISAGRNAMFALPALPDRWGSLLDACQLSILSGLREGAHALPGAPGYRPPRSRRATCRRRHAAHRVPPGQRVPRPRRGAAARHDVGP